MAVIESVIIASAAALVGSALPLLSKGLNAFLSNVFNIKSDKSGVKIVIERRVNESKGKTIEIYVHDAVSVKEFVEVVKHAAEEGKTGKALGEGSHG